MDLLDLPIRNAIVIARDDDRRGLDDAAVVTEKTMIAEASAAAMMVWKLVERRGAISQAIA